MEAQYVMAIVTIGIAVIGAGIALVKAFQQMEDMRTLGLAHDLDDKQRFVTIDLKQQQTLASIVAHEGRLIQIETQYHFIAKNIEEIKGDVKDVKKTLEK